MKLKFVFNLLLIALPLVFGACSDKEPDVYPQPRGGEFTVKVNHLVNGKPCVRDQFLYMTQAGDSFQITLLQYYLSNFEFHSPESGWKKLDKYRLVRLDAPSTFDLTFKDLPFGGYDSIRFYVGLDSAANHDAGRLAELDPGYGMIWTWTTGYLFYMFEGKFVDSNNLVVPFAYHIGLDSYLMKYEMPIQNIKTLSAANAQATISLDLEIDEIFRSPDLIELNHVPSVSHTFDEPVFTQKLKNNLLDAFSAK